MPKAGRMTDIATGHGCFPPTPIVQGSGNVFTNKLKALRKGDAAIPHGCSNCPPHGRSVSGGSSSVFINGKPAARVGDGIGCGGSVSGGSGNVYIGDKAGGGPQAQTLRAAAEAGLPICEECSAESG